MFIKANTMDYILGYIEDEINTYFEHDFLIRMITDMLSVYRDEVFDLLVSDGEKDN